MVKVETKLFSSDQSSNKKNTCLVDAALPSLLFLHMLGNYDETTNKTISISPLELA